MKEILVQHWNNSVKGNVVMAWCEVCGVLYQNKLGTEPITDELIAKRKKTASNHRTKDKFAGHAVEVHVYKKLPSREEIVGQAVMSRFRKMSTRV